ncbi:hypothetical protein PSHT_12341 [Puccinia striiformis]|uniref:Beta-hexosaminidase n=1 Tax=Puccinia striiformis TaxID=27350 RepID=A0A2S4UX62_9BASI|nr:hypothetical protein PSHT_12341 [Puccinia striiformis]
MLIKASKGFASLLILLTGSSALWPEPQYHNGNGQQEPIRISPALKITLQPARISSELEETIKETLKLIRQDEHHELVERSISYDQISTEIETLSIELTPSITSAATTCLHLLCDNHLFTNSNYAQSTTTEIQPSIIAEMQLPINERNEAYEIKIERNPNDDDDRYQAILIAHSALGILRGLQSFTQLIYTTKPASPTHPKIKYIHGPLHIKDSPAFPYRGLLLDTSRNYYSIQSIKKTLKAMSYVKLNVLHWHITDSQSWPIQIPSQPNLSSQGSYSEHEIYTMQNLTDITRFANSIGIEILLEVDTPGHTAIIGESFPELIACKDKIPWSHYANEPPAGQLRLADDRSLNLINEIFQVLTSRIPGTLFSSGGDEINKRCYEEDEPTQISLHQKNQTFNQALSRFVLSTHETIRRSGKTPVVWEELVLDEGLPLSTDHTIVSVWRNSSMVHDVIHKGYKIIHGASDYSYLDCGLGGWLGNSINGTSWCDPYKIYSFDPYKNVPDGQQDQVLGEKSSKEKIQDDRGRMKSECVQIDRMNRPRALSTAEVYWTGNRRSRSVNEALPRMHDMRYRLVDRGVRAAPLQPHWCAIRPGQCDLPPGTHEN